MTVLTENEAAALAELERLIAPEPMTLDEIATRLNVSKEWVRTIERRSLAKMRRAAMRDRLAYVDYASPPADVAPRPRGLR